MGKANKKDSPSKNKKNSPAEAAIAHAIASKEAADAARQELRSLVANNGKHSIGSWDNVEQKLRCDKASNCSVFLGNGFNIAIGVRTSYEELGQDLLRHGTTKDFLKNKRPDILAKIDKEPGDIEMVISKDLEDNPCQPFIKDIFYERIMKRFNKGYSEEKIMGFLALFSKFFTTNYDPLLYNSLRKMKKGKIINKRSPYYLKVVQINKGKVTTPGEGRFEGDTVLLKDMAKKLRYELSKYIMSKGQVASQGMNDFYKVLSCIEKEIRPEVDFDDGFRPPANDKKARYMEWTRPGKREDKYYKDNMFYLHGGFFIYVGHQGKTCKVISGGPLSFVNHIRTLPYTSPLCIFEGYGSDKKEEICKNDYLRNCLRELGNISGNLCIVGWRCHENDHHLTECINENSRIKTLLVGYCQGDRKTTVDDYTKKFPDKKIIFWDVGEAPFDINKIKEEEKIKKLEIAAGGKA